MQLIHNRYLVLLRIMYPAKCSEVLEFCIGMVEKMLDDINNLFFLKREDREII